MKMFLFVAMALAGCASLERDQRPGRGPDADFTDAGVEQPPPTSMPDAGQPETPPDADPPPPDAPDGECEGACENDLECGPDQKCDNGQCYERCSCDEDCETGRCIWGICKPN